MSDSGIWKNALRPSDSCPDAEALAAAAQNPEIQRHLEGCARCRTELALLHEFESAQAQASEAASVDWIEGELKRRSAEILAAPVPPLPQPPARKSLFAARWRVLALAASAICLVGAGVYWRGATEPALAPPSSTPVWRSGSLTLIAPVGDVASAPREFRWESVSGAASYRVHLFEVDGREIWTADSAAPSIVPPPAVLDQLAPARAFAWRVEARNAAGQVIAGAPLQNFHIPITAR